MHIEPIPPEEAATGPSPLDAIRAIYANAQAEQRLTLPVPRTAGLGVRYRAIDPDEYTTQARSNRDANVDFLIAACECVCTRSEHGWEPLVLDGEPVRFDETLAGVLGLPGLEQGGSARDVVLKVFSKVPQPHMAIARHVVEITNWMAGEGALDEESLLGES
jgi:hypothetical protein